MTYGVAEVEGLSQSTLPLICGHDISLDGDVACDNGGEAINAGSGERAPLELGKERGVRKHRVLDHLSARVAE